jgi:hypothetical protein
MSQNDPLLRWLADANPVPAEAVTARSKSPSADRLLQDITTRPRWFRPRRRTRLAFVLASALVGVVVIAVAVLPGARQAPASAAELLRKTAVIAEGREAPVSTGRYLYTKTVTEQLSRSEQGGLPWSVVRRIVEETWIAPDGSGRIRSRIGEPRFLGARDQARWEAAGSPDFPTGLFDESFPAGALVYQDVRVLPTGPSELLSVLREQVSSAELPLDVAVFLRVGVLLGRGDAPPGLRAALYRVASDLEGIELAGPITDPLGRTGVGVSMSYKDSGAAIRVLMVFDDETSVLLSQERFLVNPASWVDAETGTRISFIAYAASGRTASREDPLPT